MFLISRPLIYLGFVVLFKNPGLRPGPAIGLSMLLVASGHFAFSAAKRLAARRIWAIEGAGSPAPPILFLRCFQDDQFEVEPPKWDVVSRWFDLWSFRRNVDQILIDECAQYGPVIALGRPGERKVPFGAARYYATQQEWQTVVTDAARRAQAIVIAAGDSPGVLWEYELLSREHLLNRTLLLFRPAKEEDQANRRALDAFSQATTQIQVGDVARNDHLIALFDSGDGPRLLMARKLSAACYLVALRAQLNPELKNRLG